MTEDLLRSIGEAVPGLDVDKMLNDRSSAEVTAAMAGAQASAQAAGVATGPTPTFDIGRTGGSMKQFQGVLPIDQFRQVLDGLLQQ